MPGLGCEGRRSRSAPHAPRTPFPGPRRRQQDLLDPTRAEKRKGPPQWALRVMRQRGLRRLATLVAALLCLAMIVAVSGVKVARGSAGTVGVVRNGGPLDARTIRQIIMPGQSITYTGFFSQSPHVYPASHVTLKYTVTSSETTQPQPAVDTIVLPTKDGVQVGIDAAVFFSFVGDADLDVLSALRQGRRHTSIPHTHRPHLVSLAGRRRLQRDARLPVPARPGERPPQGGRAAPRAQRWCPPAHWCGEPALPG